MTPSWIQYLKRHIQYVVVMKARAYKNIFRWVFCHIHVTMNVILCQNRNKIFLPRITLENQCREHVRNLHAAHWNWHYSHALNSLRENLGVKMHSQICAIQYSPAWVLPAQDNESWSSHFADHLIIKWEKKHFQSKTLKLFYQIYTM